MKFTLAIGNPPYGVGGNLAIKFLNKTSEITDDIRFVLPTSIRKPSCQNKIKPYLHCEVDEQGYPNTSENIPDNPDSGSKLEFRSDDSVPQGTLNGGSVYGTITPSPNSNGRMEYEFIASNPAGSTTKKMTIE